MRIPPLSLVFRSQSLLGIQTTGYISYIIVIFIFTFKSTFRLSLSNLLIIFSKFSPHSLSKTMSPLNIRWLKFSSSILNPISSHFFFLNMCFLQASFYGVVVRNPTCDSAGSSMNPDSRCIYPSYMEEIKPSL